MTPILATIDPWILTFSAVTVIATIFMGFWSARKSKTASDFFVAGRSVSVGWNASAISGEYLSAASFMGVAGMVMSSGYDALWYPVCYACGYLFLLLFIAGPLRRFGAYTIPDFAEGRFDSPLFRKIAVVFVLFIGFFYTMPQMKGAGTTLAYIFPGLPYWAGVVLVGAVITLNVALGGMKGITLVQAFQYWAKMFAISVPIFVLMAVYGHYGKQLGANGNNLDARQYPRLKLVSVYEASGVPEPTWMEAARARADAIKRGVEQMANRMSGIRTIHGSGATKMGLRDTLINLAESRRDVLLVESSLTNTWLNTEVSFSYGTNAGDYAVALERALNQNGVGLISSGGVLLAVPFPRHTELDAIQKQFGFEALTRQPSSSSAVLTRSPLPEKAPADSTWLSPFGPLTTKAAKAIKPTITYSGPLKEMLVANPADSAREVVDRVEFRVNRVRRLSAGTFKADDLVRNYANVVMDNASLSLTGERKVFVSPKLSDVQIIFPGVRKDADGQQATAAVGDCLSTNGVTILREGNVFKGFLTADAEIKPVNTKPFALLYTYSLIIALVCGTAGLPHILVRFYTNPDGVAAKRTTMWVMILIGCFYVFPPIFGVMGRNLLPDLYAGVGAKGTDKVVLELPRILNDAGSTGYQPVPSGDSPDGTGRASNATSIASFVNRDPSIPVGEVADRNGRVARSTRRIPWGSILSGVTCAGAFAAFMSTFSGLLVSMTGAMAHDVYGRMLRPKATQVQRLRAFKVCTVIIGGIAIVLGCFVEPLEINFMVGQAFAIAAASYFPLLFMSVWWRGMTMRGAAIGMLSGGLCALAAVTLTNVSNLALDKGPMGKIFSGFGPMNEFWAGHPLLRILCEQPAIWTVPLAIGLMIVVSKLTRKEVPGDVRMKMLVLHAPEKLGLKQEYIQEHQHGH